METGGLMEVGKKVKSLYALKNGQQECKVKHTLPFKSLDSLATKEQNTGHPPSEQQFNKNRRNHHPW